MPDNKDYAQMNIEELLVEEKKARKELTVAAVLIGFLVGVMASREMGSASSTLRSLWGLIYLTQRGRSRSKRSWPGSRQK